MVPQSVRQGRPRTDLTCATSCSTCARALGSMPAMVNGLLFVIHITSSPLRRSLISMLFTWCTCTRKLSLAALLILPQSVLLGMTFPLMTAGMLRKVPADPGSTISLLYFTNSIGAAAGVLASGFWLTSAVGLPGTLAVAGALNVGLAAVVWVIGGQDQAIEQTKAVVVSPGDELGNTQIEDIVERVIRIEPDRLVDERRDFVRFTVEQEHAGEVCVAIGVVGLYLDPASDGAQSFSVLAAKEIYVPQCLVGYR